MRFTIEQRFAGPLAAVEAAFIDPAFLAELATLPKLGHPELLGQQVDGDLVRQQVRYRFAGQLSSAVTRVVDPDKLTWIEESELDRRTHRTTFRINPDHYADRLRCAGTFQLEADGPDHTSRRAEADLTVRFPLVGGRVEKAIVGGLQEHAGLEAEVMARWLAKSGG